jgi:hypothetical protein
VLAKPKARSTITTPKKAAAAKPPPTPPPQKNDLDSEEEEERNFGYNFTIYSPYYLLNMIEIHDFQFCA